MCVMQLNIPSRTEDIFMAEIFRASSSADGKDSLKASEYKKQKNELSQ